MLIHFLAEAPVSDLGFRCRHLHFIEALKTIRLVKHGVADGICYQGQMAAALGSYVWDHVFVNVSCAYALPLFIRPYGKDLDIVNIVIAVVEFQGGRYAFIVH